MAKSPAKKKQASANCAEAFKSILKETAAALGKSAEHPFILYSALSDRIGDDFSLKQELDNFYASTKSHGLTNALSNGKVKQKSAPPVSPAPSDGEKAPRIPEDAYVYLSDSSLELHLTPACPKLSRAPDNSVLRATFDKARYKDYARIAGLNKNTTGYYYASKKHVPPICPICGNFIHTLQKGEKKLKFRQL